MMKDLWYTAVLIFIIFHESNQSGQRQTGSLTCVNDYLTNISCVWGNSTDFSAQRCELNGIRHERVRRSCELLPLNSHSYSERGCALTFDMNFFFIEKIILSVTCNGSHITKLYYQPSQNIKTQPPDKPTVSGVNITWSQGVNFPEDIEDYEFEVQWRRHRMVI